MAKDWEYLENKYFVKKGSVHNLLKNGEVLTPEFIFHVDKKIRQRGIAGDS
jgi:hypothetical protein